MLPTTAAKMMNWCRATERQEPLNDVHVPKRPDKAMLMSFFSLVRLVAVMCLVSCILTGCVTLIL